MLRLYYAPGTISLAPHIILNELNLCFEPVRVEVADNRLKNYKTSDFIKINPTGLVPVLAIDGATLTESLAIALHLVGREKNNTLLPKSGTWDEAKAMEWLAWLATSAHRTIGAYFRPEHLADDEQTQQRLRKYALKHMKEQALYIERRIAHDGKYATGSNFTLVDAFLLVYYRWFQVIGLPVEEQPNWRRVTESCLARQSVQKTLLTEGIAVSV